MPQIFVTQQDGQQLTLTVPAGRRLMEALRDGGTTVEGTCGGACSCGTCHVYVDDAWAEKTGAPEPMEEDMLDFAFEVRPTSRLSCQIRVRPELDGLVVHTPKEQG